MPSTLSLKDIRRLSPESYLSSNCWITPGKYHAPGACPACAREGDGVLHHIPSLIHARARRPGVQACGPPSRRRSGARVSPRSHDESTGHGRGREADEVGKVWRPRWGPDRGLPEGVIGA